jgi:hypothetical protein
MRKPGWRLQSEIGAYCLDAQKSVVAGLYPSMEVALQHNAANLAGDPGLAGVQPIEVLQLLRRRCGHRPP